MILTLALQAPLPPISEALVIDGCTQSGAGCEDLQTRLAVILDGHAAGAEADGLQLASSGSHIHGLAITGFGRDGLRVLSGILIIARSPEIYLPLVLKHSAGAR